MEGQMMVPIYAGYAKNDKKEGKKDSKAASQYDDKTKQVLKELGLLPPEEDEMRNLFRPHSGRGMPLYGHPGRSSSTMPMYMMPPSMTQGMQSYSPMGMMQGMPRDQIAGPQQGSPQGYGNTSQINIQYAAPDGTMYQMGVSTTPENRGKVLYNVLSGLYGLMSAEDGGGKYGKGGLKSGGGKSYSGGKGSSGGKGGK